MLQKPPLPAFDGDQPRQTKHCRKCNHTKPSDQFYRNRNKSDGLSTYCAICERRRHIEWKNRDSKKHGPALSTQWQRWYEHPPLMTREEFATSGIFARFVYRAGIACIQIYFALTEGQK